MLQGLYKNNEELEKQARNYSIIHWETGEPKAPGAYLVTIDDDFVTVDSYTFLEGWRHWDKRVTAWVDLNDITPYNYKNEEL